MDFKDGIIALWYGAVDVFVLVGGGGDVAVVVDVDRDDGDVVVDVDWEDLVVEVSLF